MVKGQVGRRGGRGRTESEGVVPGSTNQRQDAIDRHVAPGWFNEFQEGGGSGLRLCSEMVVVVAAMEEAEEVVAPLGGAQTRSAHSVTLTAAAGVIGASGARGAETRPRNRGAEGGDTRPGGKEARANLDNTGRSEGYDPTPARTSKITPADCRSELRMRFGLQHPGDEALFGDRA
ncbi:hypothetical protein KM043_008605 [Ampulex compressa]|nr:hypothetical protein KM043_008605 [Ampulex compressa]